MSDSYIKIMPMGDSITQGFTSSDLRGYRSFLLNLAELASWSIRFVGSLQDEADEQKLWSHEGHYGWRIDELCSYIKPHVSYYQPDVILLHIGTNDILHGCSVTTAIARLKQLLDCIYEETPSVHVFVAKITPLGFQALNSKLCMYNQLIPHIVQNKIDEGRAIQSVDIYSAVSTSMIHDKIHVDNSGYLAIAHCWFQALQTWFERFAPQHTNESPYLS